MLKDIKHIFFDLDDTLWDFEKNSTLVLQQLFIEFELNSSLNTNFETFNSTYKKVNSLLWQQYHSKEIEKNYLRNCRFNLVCKEFNYTDSKRILDITEYYLSKAPNGKHLKAGCIETLTYLKEKYDLHIITNGFKEVQEIKIKNCGLNNYFKNIIISEEYQLAKPNEQIFRLAEKVANAKKEECIMIGDNFENDIKGALNAGWQAVYFSKENYAGYTGDHITNLNELTYFL